MGSKFADFSKNKKNFQKNPTKIINLLIYGFRFPFLLLWKIVALFLRMFRFLLWKGQSYSPKLKLIINRHFAKIFMNAKYFQPSMKNMRKSTSKKIFMKPFISGKSNFLHFHEVFLSQPCIHPTNRYCRSACVITKVFLRFLYSILCIQSKELASLSIVSGIRG